MCGSFSSFSAICSGCLSGLPAGTPLRTADPLLPPAFCLKTLPVIRPWRIASLYPSHSLRGYVFCKVLTDPLYPAVCAELRSVREPVLDVGCGTGVFAFCLRECGWEGEITGFDTDAEKIAAAQEICTLRKLDRIRFTTGDAREELPAHHGSVTILDMLQYLTPAQQTALLQQAAARTSLTGVLIIRSGVINDGWRFRLTRLGDQFAEKVRWMRQHAAHYPTVEFLTETLSACGLHGSMRPLYGHTPFNNWLGVFRR